MHLKSPHLLQLQLMQYNVNQFSSVSVSALKPKMLIFHLELKLNEYSDCNSHGQTFNIQIKVLCNREVKSISAHRKVKVVKLKWCWGIKEERLCWSIKKQPVVKNKQSSIPVTPDSVGHLEEASWTLTSALRGGRGFSGCEVGQSS